MKWQKKLTKKEWEHLIKNPLKLWVRTKESAIKHLRECPDCLECKAILTKLEGR